MSDPDAPRRLGGPGWLVLGVAFFVRFVHVAALHHSPVGDVVMGDGAVYSAWAQRLAAGDWLGDRVFYQAPLYPYFLGVVQAVLGESVTALRVVQSLLGSLGCVLLAGAGCRLVSRRAGVVAGLLLAVYPPAVFFDGLVQKAALASLLMCLSLRLVAELVHAPGRLAALGLGVASGLLVLTRENALLVVAALAVWLLARWRRRAVVPALLLGAGLALVLLPVALRNHAVGGELHLTTSQFGPNLYIGNNAEADGTYRPLLAGRGNALVERQDAVDLAQDAVGRELTPSEVSAYWTRRALDDVTEDPARWAALLLRKLSLAYNDAEVVDAEDIATYADWSPVLAVTLPVLGMGVLLPLAVLGLVVCRRRAALAPLLVVVAAYTATLLLFYVFARYRFPLVPPLVLLAASGLDGLGALRPGAPGRVWLRWAAVLVLVPAAAWWSHRPLVDLDGQRATMSYNLGVKLAERGELAKAIDSYRDALALAPDHPQARNNLAQALLGSGRPDEAVAELSELLRREPAYTRAWVNLGAAHEAAGDDTRAAAAYGKALELDPRLPEAWLNLGLLWLRTDHPKRARTTLRRASELAPGLVPAWWALATAHERLGEWADARDAYDAVLRLQPDDATAAAGRARAAAALAGQDG